VEPRRKRSDVARPSVATGIHRSVGLRLASMNPASHRSVLCSGPRWISARLRSHWWTGLKSAIRIMRWAEKPILLLLSVLSCDLGRKTGPGRQGCGASRAGAVCWPLRVSLLSLKLCAGRALYKAFVGLDRLTVRPPINNASLRRDGPEPLLSPGLGEGAIVRAISKLCPFADNRRRANLSAQAIATVARPLLGGFDPRPEPIAIGAMDLEQSPPSRITRRSAKSTATLFHLADEVPPDAASIRPFEQPPRTVTR
jgi:hypothetical protein